MVELLPTAEEDGVVGHLGPDLLGPDWDLAEAVRRIEAQPDRSIGEALLDQRNLAGIGTFYRAELLFLQGLHPRMPVREVRNLTRLVQRGQQLLPPTAAGRSSRPPATCGGRRAYVFERPGQPAGAAAHRSGPRSSALRVRNVAAIGARVASRSEG